MKIAMIGAGYVGLVSGACFADFGHTVTCVDLDHSKIEALRRAEIPIFEPGLDALVRDNVASGRLSFSTELSEAVVGANVVFIAVGTPSRRGDGHADLSFVHSAAASIAELINGFTIIVTKSTVPVGTGDEVERIIREKNPKADFAVVSNPEFLREGAAIEDFKRPDRIVIGIEDERARSVMAEVYRPLYLNQAPIQFTARRTAEIIKYAANSFLAMKITFMNEVADFCERAGGDVKDVARGIGLDKRIGSKFLHAGPGFGGSCFPKDAMAFARSGQDFDSPLRLVETTIAINDQRKRMMAGKVVAACGGDVRGRKIAVLGLTFKPNTDDMREAPSIAIIQALQEAGAEITTYDPQGMEAARPLVGDVRFAASAYEAANGADCAVIVTEWNEFRSLDFSRLGETMAQKNLVDLRNIYEPEDIRRQGFAYHGVGRGEHAST